MTTPESYVATVAPYPEREEDATADAMTKSIACMVQADVASLFDHWYLRTDAKDKQGARDFGLLASRVNGHYGVLLLLRTLIEQAPDKADEVARRLWNDWHLGDAAAELTPDWLVGYGIDPDRVIAEAKPVTRIDATA